jgi:PIN domain nuclease of toxin-antitoxin system
MNYLLDTHVLIWVFVSTGKLSLTAKNLLLREPQIYVSAVSLWEISIKYMLKRLDLKGKTPENFSEEISYLNFLTVDLKADDAATFYKLPKRKNKDPFDRMLAWQAICGNYTLISKDEGFDNYKKEGLRRMW